MKNKKILGALAALCMGIILCVSSVFAVNYWYTINNNGSDNTVSTGRAITLSVANAEGNGADLYPGGIVTFEKFTVDCDDWDKAEYTAVDPVTGAIKNTTLPTFNLKVTGISDGAEAALAACFEVYLAKDDATTYTYKANLSNGMYLYEDLQDMDDFTVSLRLYLKPGTPMSFAEQELTFKVEIVALIDDAEIATDKDSDPATGIEPNGDDQGIVPGTGVEWTPAP